MFKQAVKIIFENGDVPYIGVPNLAKLMPLHVGDLYFDYYKSGTGLVVFLIFILIFAVFGLLTNQRWQRWLVTTTILLTGLLWRIDQKIAIRNSEFHLNVFGLFVPRIPYPLYFILFAITLVFAFLFFHNTSEKYGSVLCRFLFDGLIIVLLVLFLMPVFTGELFVL